GRVARAQQVTQEVFVALARGAEHVGPPHGADTREVLRRVGVFGGEAQAARAQLVDHVVCYVAPGLVRGVGEVQRIAVESWMRWQPAQPRGQRVAVGEGASPEEAA